MFYLAFLPSRDLRKEHVKVLLGSREISRFFIRVDVILLDSFLSLPLDRHQPSILGSADLDAALQAVTAKVPLDQKHLLKNLFALLDFFKCFKASMRLNINVIVAVEIQVLVGIAEMLRRTIVAGVLTMKIFQPWKFNCHSNSRLRSDEARLFAFLDKACPPESSGSAAMLARSE